jgi:alpha-tubulin suppressor-like RCC1 family protein
MKYMKPFNTISIILYLLAGQRLVANEVIGWGDNIAGQAAGVQMSELSSTGVTVTISNRPLGDVKSIAAGFAHSLALENDGTVIGWGFNRSGQAIGFPTINPENTNGIVDIGGQTLSNVVAIAAGGSHSLALRRDGTVVAWGDIGGLAELTNVAAVASGRSYNLAVKRDGTVVAWNNHSDETINGLSNAVSVAAGEDYYSPGLALKNDGSVVAFLNYKTDAPPSAKSNIVAIAVGSGNCMALRKDGLLIAWPYSSDSETKLIKDVAAISAGGRHALALKKDGTVFAWGNNLSHQAEVPTGLSNVIAIAAGNNFSLAITTNRAVAERFMPKSK